MQIIQSILGNKSNPLGQNSYLGYHYQNRNFIQPLVLAKPIFQPSRIFLKRQGKPFVDTLFTDGIIDGFSGDFTERFIEGDRSGNLDINDSDIGFSEVSQITRERSDDFSPENSIATTNKFDLGNVSHLLQTEIAQNFSNNLSPETPVKSKTGKTKVTKNNRNTSTNSTQNTKSRKQPKNTTTKTTKPSARESKLSINQKVKDIIDNSEIKNQLVDNNVIDNPQPNIQVNNNPQQVQESKYFSNNSENTESEKIPVTSENSTSENTNSEEIPTTPENTTSEIQDNRKINSHIDETARLENTNLEEIPATPENTTSEIQDNRKINSHIDETARLENTNVEEIPATPENTTSEIQDNRKINPRLDETARLENTNVEEIPATPENTTSEIQDNLKINSHIDETPRLENTNSDEIPATPENTTSEIQDNLKINSHIDETPRLENTNSEEIPATPENTTSEIQDNLKINSHIDETPRLENTNSEEIPATPENTTSEIQDNLKINSHIDETPRLENTNSDEIPATPENTTSEIQDNRKINPHIDETPRLENTNSDEIPATPENTTSEIQKNIEINSRLDETPRLENTNSDKIPATPENTTSEIKENIEINSRLDETPRLESTELEEIPENKLDINPRQTENATSENISSQDNENNTSEINELDEIDKEANELINKLPAPQGYATGGQVTATTVENQKPVAPSDTVPAMLTPGEFVINAKDAGKHLPVLEHINTGGSPEEIISPKLEQTNTEPPQRIDSPGYTTKVESLQDSTLQRKEPKFDTSSEPTSLTSPSLGLEIGKQHLSMVNSSEINGVKNTTNTSTNISRKSAPHYSSPSLIFRKPNSDTYTNTNTQTPSEWSSIEDLLSGSNEQFTDFNFSSGNSQSQYYSSSGNDGNSAQTQIFTKPISANSNIINGGNFTPPDILRDVEPVTETIDSQYSSVTPEGGEENEEDEAKIEALAQEIYYRLRQRIEIEKERYGKSVGRLPW